MTQISAIGISSTAMISKRQRTKHNKKSKKMTKLVAAGILISSLTLSATTTTAYIPTTPSTLLSSSSSSSLSSLSSSSSSITTLSLHSNQENVYKHHLISRRTNGGRSPYTVSAFGRILPTISSSSSSRSIATTTTITAKTPFYRNHIKPTLTICHESKNDASKSGPEPDEEEWNALIAAFQMYKAAYGDLKVPARFVVPSMPPWPESAWGLKLGQRVAAIRATGKYVRNNEQRSKLLDELGFLWRLRAAGREKKMDGITFDQVLAALQTYRTEIQPEGGALRVPSNFIVPDCEPWPENTRCLPLGSKIPTIRSKAYLKANPGATEQLAKIGFEFDGKVAANDERYNRVYQALVRYKELNGDLLVPQPFVIPEESSDWPENTWGLRLGARVNAIRSQGTFVNTNEKRKDELNALGFVWEKPVASKEKKRGRKKKVVNEALMGPAPPGILSSEETNGETQATNAYDETSLFGGGSTALGSSPQWAMEDEDLMLTEPKGEDLDWKPPPDFADTNKLAQQRAIEVGIIDSIGEHDTVVKGHIDQKHPWFNDDFGGEFVFEDVVEALTIYKSIHGSFENLDLDEFVVPDPAEFGLMDPDIDLDLPLEEEPGITASTGPKSLSDEDLISKEIEQMELEIQSGITSTALEPTTEDLLMEQQRMEEGSLATVTSNQQWPEHLVGMQLGPIVRRIQEGDLEVKHLPERKKQLDELGFDWGDPKKFLEVPFDKAMCAMFAYYMIRGDLFVYEDFVMPDEDPWPKALAGFELGKAVFHLRAKQNFLEAYYPRKKYMLNMIEFVWFPLDALPLDPDEAPLSWEQEHVKHIGHPLARINDPPYSAVEHVHPVDHPEAKDRYEFDYELVRDYYEDELGVTDIGNYLRERGFMELAEEHEAKYGKAVPKSEKEDYDYEYEDEYEEEEYDEEEYDEEEYDEEEYEEGEYEDDDEYEEELEEEDETFDEGGDNLADEDDSEDSFEEEEEFEEEEVL